MPSSGSKRNPGYWWSRATKSTVSVAAFSTLVRRGAQLVLLPVALHYLSLPDQALWWVLISLGNIATLADFGFGQGVMRIYSFFWAGADDFVAEGLTPPSGTAEPNLPKLRTLNWTMRYLYTRLSLGAMVLLGGAGSIYLYKVTPAAARSGHLWLIWGFYLVAVTINFASTHWISACAGVDSIRQTHWVFLISSLAYVAVAVVMLKLGCGLASIVAATFVRGALIWVLARSTFHAKVAEGAKAPPDLSMLRRLWPNGRKFGILSLGGYFLSNGSVLISYRYFSKELAAAVGLTNQIGTLMMQFAGLWLEVKWPLISGLRTQGRLREMGILFARRFAFVMATFVVVALLVILAGNPLLALRHSKSHLIPMPYLAVYFFYLWQQLGYLQFSILTFTENVVPFVKIALVTGVAMIVLSLMMTPRWGLWGLILAPFLAEAAYSTWFTVRRGFNGQPLLWPEFMRAAAFGRV